MWEDLPKQKRTSAKVLIVLIIILVLGAIGYAGYVLFMPVPTGQSNVGFTPTSLKIVNSPSPSVSASLTPSASPSQNPSPTNSQDYKVPEGETYVSSSTADTNGDSKEEILVITKLTNGKYHAYVLTSDGQVIFENKELAKKPIRIMTQTFDVSESYLSWMLVFTEQSGDLAFVHWNGTTYEIPASSGI